MKIKTSFVYPPIPVRDCDWAAWVDGDEPNDDGNMTIGRGRTEQDAIADLRSALDLNPECECCECGEKCRGLCGE